MSGRRAFTLIELLVVISIIALLISILLPALGSARRSALETQCASDQRSLGQAAVTVATDEKGVLPDLGSNADNPKQRASHIYWTFINRRDHLEDYGAQRSNWYSVTNDAWNRDDFYNYSAKDMVFGRFYFASSVAKSEAFSSLVRRSPNLDLVEGKPIFATRLEDAAQIEFLWTDLNRVWPAGVGNFTTPSDPLRRGANHLGDEPLQPLGSHVTLSDGSTAWAAGIDIEKRLTFNGSDIWW